MATDPVAGTTSRGRDAPLSAATESAPHERTPVEGDATRDVSASAPRRVQRSRRWLAAVLALAAVTFAVDAGWIHAKAALAQVLLERAWQQRSADGSAPRPWPWADTAPVARLRVERLAIDQIVLAGDSGRVLAFGPGWAPASAPPGERGAAVISGHRDTHFGWLREVAVGDVVELDAGHGAQRYRIETLRVADAARERITLPDAADGSRLLLVTCWPFDAVVAGGPLRYVASARRVDAIAPAGRILESQATPAPARLPAWLVASAPVSATTRSRRPR